MHNSNFCDFYGKIIYEFNSVFMIEDQRKADKIFVFQSFPFYNFPTYNVHLYCTLILYTYIVHLY